MRSLNCLFLFGLAIPLSGCEKYALDRKMESLCKKDGGIYIYEYAPLPEKRFDPNGKVIPYWQKPPKFEWMYGPEYRLTWNTSTIDDGDPVLGEGRLVRDEIKLIRTSDEKEIAISIKYIRTGGDFIYYSHFSSKICPENKKTSIESAFIKGGQK